jgi:hypothetical protein
MNPTDPGFIESLLQPGHLVLAISIITAVGVGGYFAFPFLFDKGMSRSIKNGFGTAFEAMLLKALDAQTEHQNNLLNDRFEKHEELEAMKLNEALSRATSDMGVLTVKLDNISDHVDDLRDRVRKLEDERG